MRNLVIGMIGSAALTLILSADATAQSSNSPFAQAMKSAMSSMETAMMRVEPTANTDVDFARMMIPHHAGAIRMAEAELQYGHDKRLRRLAQEIIVTQQSEIDAMRLALHSTTP